jgi:lipid II:glycine glycyltransferase (peptidoglycan interpeptide bridge formation enzyme)
LGQFLREIFPFKKATPFPGAINGTLAWKLLRNITYQKKTQKFANIFLPLKNIIKTEPGSFSFHKLMQWTHTKAVFADAGNSYYKNEYDPFSIDQI